VFTCRRFPGRFFRPDGQLTSAAPPGQAPLIPTAADLADLFAGNHSARTLLGACEFWIACGSGSTALPAIARPSDKEQEQTFGEMSNGEAEAEARRCEQDQRPD